ncbi:deoxyuridine 5'-triphosphate nucleotidohydrolase (dut) [Balnearium lithotrophicum]|uniref:dUTP diphosphatase n=1 Tax=Balnearium lithotrophicum TaxID=223788 RepID=A0A521CJJ1_9BACT|nr:dUTP diphosphatase [Balnearium lithotrophicum]SMO59555.1 deoxyuridine 5'-triphosphate nucleotidohydrolase (dut) [Balnearium lithotrophicum]
MEFRAIPGSLDEFKHWVGTIKELGIVIIAKSEELLPVVKYDSNGIDCKADLSESILFRSKSNKEYSSEEKEREFLFPMERALVSLGFKVYMPRNCYMDIRPRSGLAWKNGITILNSPGFVDNDYRNTVKALLINFSAVEFELHHGDRICQAVFSENYPIYIGASKEIFERFDEFFPSKRGKRGFGSTGVR